MNRYLASGALAIAGEGPEVFGYYWETVHLRTGDVVGEGFSRLRPQLRQQPGYGHRLFAVVELNREDVWTSLPPTSMAHRPG